MPRPTTTIARLDIRIDPKTKARYAAAAEAARQTLTQWILRACDEQERRERRRRNA